MIDLSRYGSDDPIAWCPGCGNFGILSAVKQALAELDIEPENTLFVSGIGQAAKLPHYLRCNMFNGLHGRALPVAAGARIANHDLAVIAVGGDGDGYSEGGNHFIHAMRRNLNMTYLVHDNQIYALTKGQASPTTDKLTKTGTTPWGVYGEPERPLALAVASNCSFVARGFSGDQEHLTGIIKEAITHKGFSFVDILQPCVTFNKINTFKWYSERVTKLDGSYDPRNRIKAFETALEWGDRIPIGVIFKGREGSYEEATGLASAEPLAHRGPAMDIGRLLEEFK